MWALRHSAVNPFSEALHRPSNGVSGDHADAGPGSNSGGGFAPVILVSDNNFNPTQFTQFLAFELLE
jgi:hypothetical protein